MKKLLIAIGAIALLGLANACVDPMEVDWNSPEFDPVKDAVTTQFVINIAPAEEPTQTKQTTSAVQKDNKFRGIDNATLFTITMTDQFMGGDGSNLVDGLMIPWVEKKNTTTSEVVKLAATSAISLNTALLAGSIDPTGSGLSTDAQGNQTGTPKSRRIIEINIPKSTNTLLFYGEAVTGETTDALNAFGGLDYTVNGLDLTAIGCSARQRLPQYAKDENGQFTSSPSQVSIDYARIEKILMVAFNRLFKVGVNGTDKWDDKKVEGFLPKNGSATEKWETKYFDFGTEGSTALKTVHWADFKNCSATTNSPLPGIFNKTVELPSSQMEILLAQSYNAFMNIRSGELRAGTGAAISRQINDLYSVMSEAASSAATSEQEEVAKLIINEIVDYIGMFWYTNDNCKWRPIFSDNENNIIGVKDTLSRAWGMIVEVPSKTVYTLQDFPFHFDLPMGGSTLKRDRPAPNDTFYFNSGNIALTGMTPTVTGAETQYPDYMTIHDYTYPPSLVYYGNSPVRISKSNNLKNKDYLDGASDWENGTWNASVWEAGFGHVTSDTRGVAMCYNIQYGTALLQTTVRFGDDVTDVLLDNNYNINGEPAKQLSLNDGSLQLTGILIGGQPTHVGWNYLATPESKFNRMIYDKRINGANAVKDTYSDVYTYPLTIPISHLTTGSFESTTPNYTVVFDNYNPNLGDAQADVYVALEFKNSLGKDFWGNANMVRNGGTFYLIGKLELSSAKYPDNNADAFWNSCSKIMPPYEIAAGNVATKKVKRVFFQDHTTKADFVISKTSLQNAFVTVPDLRTAKMSIGLSVDLAWGDGIEFENVILGQL